MCCASSAFGTETGTDNIITEYISNNVLYI